MLDGQQFLQQSEVLPSETPRISPQYGTMGSKGDPQMWHHYVARRESPGTSSKAK